MPTLKQYLLQNSISLIKLVYRIAILRYWAILVHFLSFMIFFFEIVIIFDIPEFVLLSALVFLFKLAEQIFFQFKPN